MDRQQPARSGLAAEIIARNAAEGASTSDTARLTGSVPARALDLCVDYVQELEAKLAEKTDRIAELERREALLTATTIKLRQWMQASDTGTPSEESAAFMELAIADGAVDWLEPPAYVLLPSEELETE